MNQENQVYIAIDLKSFYASVECVERKLNPMTTNLVVADASKLKDNLSCSVPSLKSMGFQDVQDYLKLFKSKSSKCKESYEST